MLSQLETILHASAKVLSFQIIDNDPVDADEFLFKLRCELTSGHILQIRLRAVAGHLRYSYQEFADKPLQRWDNAPHFPHLSTFPHHYHDPQSEIMESLLTGNPVTDLSQVLDAL